MAGAAIGTVVGDFGKEIEGTLGSHSQLCSLTVFIGTVDFVKMKIPGLV